MDTQNLIEDHVFLAELIAFDYANIPGCQLDEARSEANMALIRAAQAYDPTKGDFIPFSSRVIRNALNSLYAKQLRLLRMFPKSLDDPIQWPQTASPSDAVSSAKAIQPSDSRQDVMKQIRNRETSAVVESIMNLLTPRERLVVNALRVGSSYVEIGESFGISKQAAHKSAKSGLAKLRAGLVRMGYRGIASDGHLGSLESKKLQDRG